jgi:hypothetical protein
VPRRARAGEVDRWRSLRYKLVSKMSRVYGFAFGFYFPWRWSGAEEIS